MVGYNVDGHLGGTKVLYISLIRLIFIGKGSGFLDCFLGFYHQYTKLQAAVSKESTNIPAPVHHHNTPREPTEVVSVTSSDAA